MGRLVLAIDEGTAGVTALLLDPQRRVVARADQGFPSHFPRPGWVEQDPMGVLHAMDAAVRAALRGAGATGADVAALGIANQRETTVVWDRASGAPVYPAIVWQDRRTAPACGRLRPRWQATVRRRTGLVIDPYFSATKLQWILRRPGMAARARRGGLAFGTMDSWLAWNLTGRHATDATNASRTLLWDIGKGAWDPELLDLFGVPEAMLPEVHPSAHVVGETTRFGGRIAVAALVGDQQAALFGQGCTRAGEAKNTYGTGCFLLQHTGAAPVASRHGLLTTRAASTDGRAQFALEGALFTAGAALDWLSEAGVLAAPSEADALAGSVPDAGGAVVVPAFTGLGAPHWDPHARGAVLGLTRATGKAHLARAALEAIALQSTEALLAMERDSGRRIPRLRVDGGVSRSRLLLQLQADLLRRPVVRPADVETTALGAGWLAGVAVGSWDAAELRRPREGDEAFKPMRGPEAARARLAAWRRAVAAVRGFHP